MIKYILLLPALLAACSNPKQNQNQHYLSVPVIDLDTETSRQVIVDREKDQYLGHPTTVLLDDGHTMFIVYPKGHGKGEIVMQKSADGGFSWSGRLKTPESWKTSLEVPTIFKLTGPGGKRRLVIFSGLYPARMAFSEDNGETWSELKPLGDWGGIVVMSAVIPLNTGAGHYMALFHDDLRYFTADGKKTFDTDRQGNEQLHFTLYKTFTTDGGLTWSVPDTILSGREMNLCEPGIIRSPDGKQLAVLLRENSRRHNSQVIFSGDEGRTWSKPASLPNELNGDRHVLRYTPDGRILAVFRDVSPAKAREGLIDTARTRKEDNYSSVAGETRLGSPTEGDWVGWIGTWDDLVNRKPGQYRIRFRDNKSDWDCAYPGVELLPDSTFVVTTYGHWDKNEQPYILSVRFKVNELDKRLPQSKI